ncbi:YheC/YheD family endospore coat-associated protein [Peribacillus glennii]|uniref:YheC/YheD family protein n=1 Tax=Peribacillus glennii TaxID=2303991 RepID=A0A372L680_9BACI|nr:YheC/YheD family protein [Peribacillus glennii]RFU60466.1 YheC/YheD family protein [Peribacillus glennii]
MIYHGTLAIQPLDGIWSLHLPREGAWKNEIDRKELTIKIGKWKKTVVVTDKEPSETAFRTQIQIRKLSGSYEIGPFIGILTVAGEDSFLGNRTNFTDILETGRKQGALAYVITVEDINWELETAVGSIFDHGRKIWVKESLPIPHIIYNRIPNRAAENRPHVISALEKLSASETTTLYNPRFFEKSHMYHILQKERKVSAFLPETVPFSRENLVNMAGKHPILYMKPTNGKAGRGIYQLQRKDDRYVLQYQLKKKNIKKFFQTLYGLYYVLVRMVKEPYVIQQGISLATYQDRIFDIRALAQKDGHGEWGITGMGIRIAGAGGITTHVPRGGSIGEPKNVLSAVFPDSDSDRMIASVHNTVLMIAGVLENEWPALAECSMDIGIDKQGKMWFIEANSKPEKFDEPHIRKLSLKRIIEYAQHKSGFKKIHAQTNKNDNVEET